MYGYKYMCYAAYGEHIVIPMYPLSIYYIVREEEKKDDKDNNILTRLVNTCRN